MRCIVPLLQNLQSIPASPTINDQPGGPLSEWVQWEGLRLALPPQGSAIASPQVLTFPKSGVLTIQNPTVKPDSVILLQYVGDRGGAALVVSQVGAGQFTATGGMGRQFRYVVLN